MPGNLNNKRKEKIVYLRTTIVLIPCFTMSILKIRRKTEWVNWTRDTGIYLDDIKLGIISNGQKKEFTIEPGSHTLKAKIDWCGSQRFPFEVREGQTESIVIGAYRHANLLLVMEVLLVITHFFLRNEYGINYVIWFAVPFLLYTLYYTTIGRNRYLVIQEDEQNNDL